METVLPLLSAGARLPVTIQWQSGDDFRRLETVCDSVCKSPPNGSACCPFTPSLAHQRGCATCLYKDLAAAVWIVREQANLNFRSCSFLNVRSRAFATTNPRSTPDSKLLLHPLGERYHYVNETLCR